MKGVSPMVVLATVCPAIHGYGLYFNYVDHDNTTHNTFRSL